MAEALRKVSPDQKALLENFEKAMKGTLGEGMDPKLRKAIYGAMVVGNIALLPFAIFSQFLDIMTLGARKNEMSAAFGAFVRGLKDIPRMSKWVDERHKRDFWETMAEDLGIISASNISTYTSDILMGMRGEGMAHKFNEAFFRYNGMAGWQRSMMVAATKNAYEFIMSHKGLPSKHSQRFLDELGLAPDDIVINSKGELQIDKKIEQAIAKYVTQAVAHPDPTTNAMWMNDPYFALLAHLKRFTFAYASWVLSRTFNEAWKNKNWYILLPLVMAVPWMIATDTVRDFIKPGPESWKADWGWGDHVWNGLERSAIFGKVQFGLDIGRGVEYGGTGIESVLGPTAESIAKLARGAHEGHFWSRLWNLIPLHQVIR